MTTDSVIEDFDVFLDRRLRLGASTEPTMVYEFLLQTAPQALDGGVIKAISFARHRGSHPVVYDCFLVGQRAVLLPRSEWWMQPGRGLR